MPIRLVYKAADVQPFETVFSNTNVALTTTSPLHIGIDPLSAEAIPVKGAGSQPLGHFGQHRAGAIKIGRGHVGLHPEQSGYQSLQSNAHHEC